MPLNDNEFFFPYNIVDTVALVIPEIDSRIVVEKRPLQTTDPDMTTSVLPLLWTPEADSREMQGKLMPEPTIQNYNIAVQGMVKDFDEPRGLRRHSQLARALRVLLYRNPVLQVALRALTTTDASGTTERVLDLKEIDQQFLGNEEEGQMIFLSTMRFQVKTQVQPSI